MNTTIPHNIKIIQHSLQKNVKLIAVSKTKSNQEILDAYSAGLRDFGENKVQELQTKFAELPQDINWHFIGHLQSNKVKYIAPFISLIHSVDSIKLLQTIQKEAVKNNRTIACLLQFHVAQEDTKHGLTIEEAKEILQSDDFKALTHVEIQGIMGMATFTDNTEQVAQEFEKLNTIFEELKHNYFSAQSSFIYKSYGMSQDYMVAMQHGSNMVRIGSTIFGSRI